MRKLAIVVSLLVAVGLMALAAAALANRGHGGNGGNRFSARLTGFEETPLSESTPGRGTFRASVNDDVIHYVLHYEGFEAAEGNTLFAHIHFGQRGTTGGVAAFLCGPAAASDKPACTPTQGTFEGDIDSADIVGPEGQGIAPGEMDEVITAMRKGYAYANVHTTLNPSGLIRGQIRKGSGHGHGKGRGDKH